MKRSFRKRVDERRLGFDLQLYFLKMALLLVEALGGQVAIVLIVLCILNLFVNMYTRIKKNKATKKW